MRKQRTIDIVGGGLAGLTLGLALRRLGVPVIIYEAGNYPRHRVCGEFICGRGLEVLERLGLTHQLFAAGALRARTSAFFTASGSSLRQTLPTEAVCLSRFHLDVLLAREFENLGGELVLNCRRPAEFPVGVVRATGRRSKILSRGKKWFGLKIHARGVKLTADLEMHLSSRGYVGICRLAGDEVNICGLFQRQSDGGQAIGPRAWLNGEPGTELHDRLATAEFLDETFCSVAGLSLTPLPAAGHAEFCVGDAVTMIPPVTGNGMSMAFESAELASAPLAAWSRGEMDWPVARKTFAVACDARFSSRLRWAQLLQSAMFNSPLQRSLIKLLQYSPGLWRLAFAKTR